MNRGFWMANAPDGVWLGLVEILKNLVRFGQGNMTQLHSNKDVYPEYFYICEPKLQYAVLACSIIAA